MQIRSAVHLLCALLLLGCVTPAHAAELPWLHDIFVSLADIGDKMTESVSGALRSAQVTLIVNVLFAALSLLLFVWKFAGFALRGFDLMDILEVMFTIFFVYLLLTAYRALLPAIASAGRFVGDSLGGAISGAEGKATLAESIFSMLLQLSLRPSCNGFWHCISSGYVAIATTIIGDLAILVLGIVATVVETWMQWCFEVAYAVGWVTVPFLLYRRLSFLFDGWLRFFFSIVMYDIVAKVTLAMVLLCFKVMQNRAPGATGATIDVHVPYDLVALFLFIVVGVFVLACTGRFATALTAGVSGIGGVLQDMARGAARATGGR